MKTNKKEPRLMKPRAAANFLGISLQSIGLDRKNGGDIPYTRVMGGYFYEKAQLEKYIDQRRVNTLK